MSEPGATFRILFPPSLGRARAAARADVLAASLGRRLGAAVEVEVAEDYADLERRVLAGEVDLAWAPPAVCARVEKSAVAVLAAVRGGRSTVRAALVCRAGEALEPGQLAGARAAWVDPLSTAGYLLAAGHLRAAGTDLAALEHHFVGSYRAALLAVLAGEADLASVYVRSDAEDELRRALEEHVGPREVCLRVMAVTGEAPADGLVVTRAARGRPGLVDSIAPLTDGSRGPTLLLELLEADTLERARPEDYAELRRVLAELGRGP